MPGTAIRKLTLIPPSTPTNRAVEWIGRKPVMTAGETLKMMSANPIAMTNANAIWPRVSSAASSGSASSPG